MMTRRDALKGTLAAVAVGAAHPLNAQPAPPPTAPSVEGPFKLPPLPYPVDALEPHIDARTMEIHHGRHHAAYVANLNKAVAGEPEWSGKSVEDLVKQVASVPEKIRTAVRNSGGGHFNHSVFWQMLSKSGGGEPKGELGSALDKAFGNFGGFKEAFTKAALGQFGSGWAWLCWDPTGKTLVVQSTPNQDSPLMGVSTTPTAKPGLAIPLLGLDVWEHAYYLKYQNRRADYAAAFFNVIHWDYVSQRFAVASKA